MDQARKVITSPVTGDYVQKYSIPEYVRYCEHNVKPIFLTPV